jgi:anthranilate phosphoribosyltransferase
VWSELTQPAGVSADVVRRVFTAILEGEWTPAQVAGFLVALRLRGETPPVIAAAAEALRDAMVAVPHSFDRLLDTCGTGGDGHGTLNLSTAAAIVAAGAGVPVAKHGNRAVSSKAGSADVLEALGIPVDLSARSAGTVLGKAGIGFFMAPTHHPAMRHAAPVRRELGVRTIFNCLGPLANPTRPTHQLLGAYDDALRPVLAEVLRSLGMRRAWVVRGADGLDEVSPCGLTYVTALDGASLEEIEVSPEDFGLSRIEPEALRGGDANENARALESIFAGAPHPALNGVLLNAAAALVVADGMEPRAAAARARETLASGRARAVLERWREAARAEREDERA